VSANSIVVSLLTSPFHRLLDRGLTALRITGRRTGKQYVLPVQYAREGDEIVVYPGWFERKTWWRNLPTPAPIGILLDGLWTTATAVALDSRSPRYQDAVAIYRRRWARLHLDPAAPLVVISASRARIHS
jgi:hypothetical protein